MAIDESNIERDPLEELAAEFTERCRRGEQPSIESYAAQNPHLADDIRDLFSTIRDVENAKESISTSGRASHDDAPAVEQLGDFRIIRELGRGGMGLVYEAEQESLGRRVAIKVLPAHYLASPTRRERFERESRTAAKLHHTNVVPIFGVGEQDGYPYFVMQYIRGVGLDVVFQRLFRESTQRARLAAEVSSNGSAAFDFGSVARSLIDPSGDERASGARAAGSGSIPPVAIGRPLTIAYWRSLAGLLAQAADALAYAHSQGVLHRDIKPSNLLLDGDGTLWVTDFGLSKAADHKDLTQAGDIVGTLRYMAPEQYSRQGDERSDVYGLGVTLYELAILQPAYTNTNGSSVVKAVLEQSLWPARRLCPSLPRDLETIIEKATAREPAHRYVSAAEMRDDLHRFLEDRPIHARRVSLSERMWRWSRRNPALAATTGLALALVLAVAVVSSTAYLRVRQANLRTQAALAGETQQRHRAESTANVAIEALDTIFDEFAPDSPVTSGEFKLDESEGSAISVSVPPVLSGETVRLLEHMLVFYQQLAHQGGQSRLLRGKIAAAQRRVGEIQERLGQYEEAKAAYAESIREYEKLRNEAGGSHDTTLILAGLQNQWGRVLFAEDRLPDAHAHYDAARALLLAYPESERQTQPIRFELARTEYLRGRSPGIDLPMRDNPGRPFQPPGRPGMRGEEGRPPRVPPRGEFRDDAWRDRPLRNGPPPELNDEPFEREPLLRPAGQSPKGVPDPTKQREHLDEAVRILTQLTKESPQVPAYRHLLAQCLRERRPAVEQRRRGFDNQGDLDRAIELLEKLVGEFPDVPQYTVDLCEAYGTRPLGPRSREQLDSAVQMMETLIHERPGDRPAVPSYTFLLAKLHARRFEWQRAQGLPRQAAESLREAMNFQRTLAENFPKVAPYVIAAGAYEARLATLRAAEREWQEAEQLLKTALARLEPLAASEGFKPHMRQLMGSSYDLLSKCLHERGADQEGRQAQQKAATYRRPPMPATQAR